MRKLLDFLVRKRHWFLFVLLEIVSLMLIYRNNAYQRNIIFSSANVLTGHIASVSGYVTSYLNLHEINKELLESERATGDGIAGVAGPSGYDGGGYGCFLPGLLPDSTEQFAYSFILAGVVNNSVSHLSNYITVNKGSKDGIAPGYGSCFRKRSCRNCFDGERSFLCDHTSA